MIKTNTLCDLLLTEVFVPLHQFEDERLMRVQLSTPRMALLAHRYLAIVAVTAFRRCPHIYFATALRSKTAPEGCV